MTRKEKAVENFYKGYNCSQALTLAFADLLPIDEDTLLRLESSFGGGMGRLREVCGAVSGMFAVAGLLYGYSDPETGAVKAEHYKRIQELAKAFEDKYGSIVCRELLGTGGRSTPTPSPRTEEYYKKRPCPELIGYAAQVLDEYILRYPPQAK